MTTQDFIYKQYNTRRAAPKWCSSVMVDEQGTVYSYGRHYPLAFHVKGLDFINDAGYSSTTSKHIAWAKRALPLGTLYVQLDRQDAEIISRTYYSEDEKLKVIEAAIWREGKRIAQKMNTKKRKDTQVYAYLKQQHDQLADNLRQVSQVMETN